MVGRNSSVIQELGSAAPPKSKPDFGYELVISRKKFRALERSPSLACTCRNHRDRLAALLGDGRYLIRCYIRRVPNYIHLLADDDVSRICRAQCLRNAPKWHASDCSQMDTKCGGVPGEGPLGDGARSVGLVCAQALQPPSPPYLIHFATRKHVSVSS